MTAEAVPHLQRVGPGRYTWDDARWQSVTTILSDGLPKPALVQWAANMAASEAVENFDELRALPLVKALDRIRYAHRNRSRVAMARGTEIHKYGEALLTGQEIAVPDQHRGPAEAYARFLDEWKIEPIAVETPLANRQHRYAGTADAWVRIGVRDRASALLEVKTGGDLYPDYALQLAAYRYADVWQPNGPASESDEVPAVDLVYAAHVLPDDVRMVPIIATPAEHRTFLYVQQVARWMRSVKRDQHGQSERVLIGEAEAA